MNLYALKLSSGWKCAPCALLIEGRQDVAAHLRDVHRVPAENIVFDETGDVYDDRGADMVGRLQKAGLL